MLRLTAPQITEVRHSGPCAQDRTALQKSTVGEIYTETDMDWMPRINNTSQQAHEPEHEHEHRHEYEHKREHRHKQEHEREHEHEHEHEHAMESW